MTATYENIATTTLSNPAAGITFNSIPGNWTDLRLIILHNVSSGGSTLCVRFNDQGGSGYSVTFLNGNGSAASSARYTNQDKIDVGNYFGPGTAQPDFITVDVFSYAGSTSKTVLAMSNNDRNGSGAVGARVGLWNDTSVITRIDLIDRTGSNLAVGTTATLYGIKRE